MRSVILLFAMCLSFMTHGQTTYPGGITGCIARWDFANNGNPIISVPDVSNNNNIGTPTNLTTAAGFRNAPNKAMSFNGTSSFATVSHNTMLQPSAITMVSMVKFNGFYSGLCQHNALISKGNNPSSGCYMLGVGDNIADNGDCFAVNPAQVQMFNHFNSFATYPAAGNYLSTGQWYLLAATYNGTAVKYYQVLMDPNTYVSNITPSFTTTANVTIGSNTSNVLLGRMLAPNYAYWFNGSMEESILFNKVLTDAEMQLVYDYLWGIVAINSVSATSFCAGQTFTVNYSVNNTSFFAANNIFTVQLSNASGSFASPVSIGSINATGGGVISCTIPSGTPSGNGYRIRIVANNVSYTTNPNTQNLTVVPSGISFSLGNDTAVCPGETVTLQPTGTLGSTPAFLWSTNATTTSITAATPGTYWLKITDGSCSNADTIVIATKPVPSVSLGLDTAVCPGENITLQPTGSFGGSATFLWNTNATSSSIVIGAPGTYWVKVSEGLCSTTDTILVNAKSSLPVFIGNDTAICDGVHINLYSSYTTPGSNFLWNTGSTAGSVLITTPGKYWLKVTHGSCIGNDTVLISSIPKPLLELGGPFGVCEGATLTLKNLYHQAGMTYQWNAGTSATSIDVQHAGDYWVIVTANGCRNSDTATVFVKPVPVVFIEGDTAVCAGGAITLHSSSQPTGTGYLWSNQGTDSSLTISKEGVYWLAVNYNGCTGVDTHMVKLEDIPNIWLGNDTLICQGKPLILPRLVTGGSDYSLLWQDGSTAYSYPVTEVGTYSVSAFNKCGAMHDTVNVTVRNCNFQFPSAFSPNGDGKNDIARLIGVLDGVSDFQWSVFNRWGNEVFTTNDPAIGWDGTYNGRPCETAVYYYFARFNFMGGLQMLRGDITIVK